MLLTVTVLVLSVLLPMAITRWLMQRPERPSNFMIPIIAALPVPAVLWLLAAYLFVLVSTSTPEQCGVDSCGMGAMAAIFLATLALIPYVFGLISSRVLIWWLDERT